MMMKPDLRLFTLLSVLAVAACRGDDPAGTDTDATDTGSSTTGGAESSTTEPEVPTTSAPSTDPTVPPTTDPSTDPTSTTDNSAGFITTNTTGDTGGEPQPNGASCTEDDECESGNCYYVAIAMQGICAECNEDQDCVDAGTGISCSVNPLAMSAECAPGEPGDSCMSAAACQEGLFCEPVIDVPIPGVFPDSCGECAESSDCANMGDICSPELDIMTFSGSNKCVAPGSVQNDQLCPEDEVEGDAACESGHCTDTDIMGIVTLHVCGECETDADCDPGQTCTPAMAGMTGLSGSVCG